MYCTRFFGKNRIRKARYAVLHKLYMRFTPPRFCIARCSFRIIAEQNEQDKTARESPALKKEENAVKKLLAAVCLVTMMGALFAGCSNGKDGSSASSGASSKASSASSASSDTGSGESSGLVSGLESGASSVVSGAESGASGVVSGVESGAESIVSGVESAIK